MADVPLELVDELYSRPLPEFTATRDALVAEHRADRELAARLRRLRKPSLAAWVVNLLVRREAAQVDQVLGVGVALRAAQAGLAGDELRGLTRQRRQLTAALTTRARQLAGERGVRVSPGVADQVEATLTAAILDEGAARAVRSGLLVTPLAATGLGEVDAASAVAVPAALGFAATPRPDEPAPRSTLRVVPDPHADAKARSAADAAVAQARREHVTATAALAEADADVERLEARALQLQAELEELRRRLVELEARQEDNDDELGDAEDVRAEAQDSAAAAARALAEAETARARLG